MPLQHGATLAPILLVMQLIRLALTLKLVKTQSTSRDELTNSKGQPVSTINAIHDLENVPGHTSPSS